MGFDRRCLTQNHLAPLPCHGRTLWGAYKQRSVHDCRRAVPEETVSVRELQGDPSGRTGVVDAW
nr:hypothetical protein JVH1_2758 [Rhodococcus sp. JVH1]